MDDWGLSEEYWAAFRDCIQLGLGTLANLGAHSNVLLKVRTVVKGPTDLVPDLFARNKGHVFIPQWYWAFPDIHLDDSNKAVSVIELVSGAKEEDGTTKDLTTFAKGNFQKVQSEAEPPTINFARDFPYDMASKPASMKVAVPRMPAQEYVDTAINKIKESGNPLGIDVADFQFAVAIKEQVLEAEKMKERFKGAGSSKEYAKPDVFDIYQKHLGGGGRPLKEIAVKKGEASQKVDSKESWAKWQRMGGDPRMHEAFPLDGAPYNNSDFTKWVGPEHADYPDAGKDDETIKSAGVGEADTSIMMVPAMSSEQLDVALEAMELEKRHVQAKFPFVSKAFADAKGFCEDDDEIFIPSIVSPPSGIKNSKKAPVNVLRGEAPMHKKIETLRAILPQVTPQSPSSGGSAYLNALGSSGVAPPPGLYNSFGGATPNIPSPMASTPFPVVSNPTPIARNAFQAQAAAAPSQDARIPPQNPYTANNIQPSSPPLNSWTSMAPAPSLGFGGFYETATPDAGKDTGRTRSGSSLSNIVRTASRSGFHSSVTGTPLRADSPAFHSTPTTRPIYPLSGLGVGNEQPGGQVRGSSEVGRSGPRAPALPGQQAGAVPEESLCAGMSGQQSAGLNNDDVVMLTAAAAAKKWFD